jgi:dinuclear metal center YbgI/SA1388 family protein
MVAKSYKLKHIVHQLNTLLRPELAQEWDNVGLLVGDPDSSVSRVLLCIDLTPAVLREAQTLRTQLILAYHPPLFKPIKTLRADRQEVLFQTARSNIAVYSIHTALDVLPGGTSDVLADLIDLQDRNPVQMLPNRCDRSKVVVFVPSGAVEKVADALFSVGAGIIGEYDQCSFRTQGIGTFRGNLNSNPVIGRPGHFEKVEEVRLDVLADNKILPQVIDAIHRSHPYEEPAFDICPRTDASTLGLGIGRVGKLASPVDLPTLVNRIKRRTKLKHLQIADAGNSKISRIAVGPGSCGDMIAGLKGKIDLFITGEVRHHDALEALRSDISVICLGHGNSERITLKPLARTLAESLPPIQFHLSDRDIDPLTLI